MTGLDTALRIAGSGGEREPLDFYPTPYEATLALLEREEVRGRILEPACGDGAIGKLLNGDVTSIDIADRGYGVVENYFFHVPTAPYDVVITNPPYRQALEFVKKGLRDVRDGGKVIMLLKLVFLEGQNRKAFFREHPPKVVYVFSKRLKIQQPGKDYKGTSMLCFAWFVWEKGYKGKTEVEWI